MEEKKKILIVDDHPIFRQGLAQLINQTADLAVCGESEDISDAMEAVFKLNPDIALVDISLKTGSGLELIKEIKKQYGRLSTLVISMHGESLYAERALRAGANGYVTKEEATDKVLSAIRQVLDGKIYVSEQISSQMLDKFLATEPGRGRSPLESLSDRELEVFELIGHGLGTRKISEQLHLSEKTIETYREHIKQKLNLKDATELVQQATLWIEAEAKR